MSRPPVEDGGIAVGKHWWRLNPTIVDGEEKPLREVWQPDVCDWWGYGSVTYLDRAEIEMGLFQLDAQAEVAGDRRKLKPGDQIEVYFGDGPRLCVVAAHDYFYGIGDVATVVDEDGCPVLVDGDTRFRLVRRPMCQTKGNNDD